jgi:hypothetical protein
MSKDKNTEWSYSFTQPYNINMNPFYSVEKRTQLDEVLDRYDIIDNIVNSMETYPDAEKLLKNIFGGSNEKR